MNSTTVERADEHAMTHLEVGHFLLFFEGLCINHFTVFVSLQNLCSDGNNLDPLLSQKLVVCGDGWSRSAADIVLSSAGWVSVTLGKNQEAELVAYTPGGRGVFVRIPALFPEAVNERGRRDNTGNRTRFRGR